MTQPLPSSNLSQIGRLTAMADMLVAALPEEFNLLEAIGALALITNRCFKQIPNLEERRNKMLDYITIIAKDN